MDKIDNKLLSHSFLMVTNHLTRAQASILMQLHIGHIPLNFFLHKISKADSPVCPSYRLANETVHHYFLDCLRYVYERHSLVWAMGHNSKSIHHLLGNWRAYKVLL